MYAQPGERFSRHLTLDEHGIAQFARLTGDSNPLHHDREFAETTRFGGIIASGTHYTALLMGLAADHFSRRAPAALGLEFAFGLRAPVQAGEPLELSWEVTAVEAKPRLAGAIVSLIGRISDTQGRTLVEATGKVLVAEKL
ncbi:MAG TPA: MaoC family dehydratase [Candidatus Competibacteraceae bacterium]|nr:MaoC family dehydratase [Candidatus Competibacteraceae bacterium]